MSHWDGVLPTPCPGLLCLRACCGGEFSDGDKAAAIQRLSLSCSASAAAPGSLPTPQQAARALPEGGRRASPETPRGEGRASAAQWTYKRRVRRWWIAVNPAAMVSAQRVRWTLHEAQHQCQWIRQCHRQQRCLS